MTTADLDSLGGQQAAQHPAACERELQVQFVQPPHDAQGPHPTPAAVRNRRLPRQMPSSPACRDIGKSCLRSIIALRSEIPPC